MGHCELHTPEAVGLSPAMDSWEEQKGAGAGLAPSCSEPYAFTAHRERGTAALPARDLQMLSSALPAGPEPAQQAGETLPSIHT